MLSPIVVNLWTNPNLQSHTLCYLCYTLIWTNDISFEILGSYRCCFCKFCLKVSNIKCVHLVSVILLLLMLTH